MAAQPDSFHSLRRAQLASKKAAGVKQVVHAGELVVSTGRLVACDPLVQPERAPFVRTIAPGRYPVLLYVARERERIGFAELRLRSTPAVRFEIATLPGQDAATLGEHESFVYPVDAGHGCFADASALRRLQAADAAHRATLGPEHTYYEIVRPTLLEQAWADHRPDSSDENVVMFRAGDGDGGYPTWFGLDADDEVTCVVTSFRVFKASATPEQKQRELAAAFAPLIAAVERDIGAVLRARGFTGPEVTIKPREGGLMTLAYARDGLSFVVDSSRSAGMYLEFSHFRWTRGRTSLDVGDEHRNAGVKAGVERAMVFGDNAYDLVARLGASYAAHWEPLERAVLALLPIKPTRKRGA